MANVINKITLEYKTSVHTPDYSQDLWIINPTLPSCVKKYWKIVGSEVVEMTSEEKAIKDASLILPVRPIRKTKMQILNEIWVACTPIPEDSELKLVEKAERKNRLIMVLNSNPVWMAFLEDYSYSASREYMAGLLAAEVITQTDYDLIDSILPQQI